MLFSTFATLGLALTVSVQPSDGTPLLRGIREIAVFYDQSELPDEETCGVFASRIKLRLQQALLDSGVKVALSGRDFSGPVAALLVTSETMPLASGRCATSMHVTFSASIDGRLSGPTTANSESLRAFVGLLSDGGLVVGPSGQQHGDQVSKALIAHITSMITKVKLANQ